MRCGSCGVENLESNRFCSECGEPVSVDVTATRTVASSTPTASRTASKIKAAGDGRFVPGDMITHRYRIVSLLGRGGMGEVYRADDLTLGQSVALKFLPEALARNADALQRFRNEVKLARQVSHPNVCRVYDLVEVDGQVFLSMEYVDGEDLASLLRRIGRLPEDKATEIARKLCAGLAAAHEKGVLHRDLKPHNVMLDARGQVLLTDFGLAGLAENIAGAEVRSGTPAYMAPEQMAGKEVTVRSDIYSLGLVIYELFTGKRPFEGTTLAELMQSRMHTTPASLSSTLAHDLDPAVERVVLRCLDPDPARRPASALQVAAALPGGDPLAAALAAGETPSPQMVAAAGEGAGLRLKFAVPLYAFVIVGIAVVAYMAAHSGALALVRAPNSPDVLRHKAREVITKAGYTTRPEDWAHGFEWDSSYLGHVDKQDKPYPKWADVMQARPPVLRFWYRESPTPMTAGEFHDDLLTPGVITKDDPPPLLTGMVSVGLDTDGRLLQFHAMPPQKVDAPKPATPADWAPLFAAADIDSSQLKQSEPQWTFIEAADTRAAWTGVWPGTNRELRVEAASFQGKPVAFAVMGSWATTDRMPSPNSGGSTIAVLAVLGLVILIASPVLARRNLAKSRSDWRGALRLGTFTFCVQMAIWATSSHLAVSMGTFAMFLLAICTSVFYGVVTCTLYLALEPFVRRYWPQTIIAWTRVFSGHLRDPIVGRDVLFGAAVSIVWRSVEHGMRAMRGPSLMPDMVSTNYLHSFRIAIGEALEGVPHGIRDTLLFFFLLFLLRVLLRNQWLGAAAFVGIFVGLAALGGAGWIDLVGTAVFFGIAAVVVMKLGLLAFGSAIVIDSMLGDLAFVADTSAWYFGVGLFVILGVLALATWAFKQSIAGQRLIQQDLFG